MKKQIHPEQNKVTAKCACGQKYEMASTRTDVSVDICAGCHPFFTGQQKFIDRAGRIEKFQRRFENASAAK